MKKIVIIINGVGGVGKDTLCGMAGRHFKVRNVSSITPIKKIAREYGGWNGEKDAKTRKFLADLKQLFVEYNDLPFAYLCDEYEKFIRSKDDILFVQIREGEEIEKFKNWIRASCITLLITRSQNDKVSWGNSSDDNVKSFHYDYIFKNDSSLKDVEGEFCGFLKEIFEEKGLFNKQKVRPSHKNVLHSIGKSIAGRYSAFLRKEVS